MACQHLDFRCLPSGTMREYISIVLSHDVCGCLLQKPRKRMRAEVGGIWPQSELLKQTWGCILGL